MSSFDVFFFGSFYLYFWHARINKFKLDVNYVDHDDDVWILCRVLFILSIFLFLFKGIAVFVFVFSQIEFNDVNHLIVVIIR